MSFWKDARTLGLGLVGAATQTVADMASGALSKARAESRSQPDEPGSAITAVPTEVPKEDPKTMFWDPYAIVEQLGYKDRPSAITYGTLNAMVWKMPIIQAIIQTRINQLAQFCVPQHDKYQMGFRIKVRDTEKEPSKAELKWGTDMEKLFLHTGVSDNQRRRPDMETFIRKTMFDSLVYDQMCFEVVPNKKGLPAQWYAVDGTTIRIADSVSPHVTEDVQDQTKYVQIYDGMVINEYTEDELCFGIRNPRSNIRLFGYGTSELEMLIPAITALLHGWEYNQRFFTQGSAAKGIINFKGIVPQRSLDQFRRHWYQMISGVENSWRTPITNSDDLQYINLQQSSKDMEMSAWLDFMIKVCCSMFCIDPIEVNFKYGNEGQKSAMQESSNKEKVTESKERGLRPLLRFMARCFNQYIVWPINPDFEFQFVGLDAKTEDDWADLNTKRVKTVMTIDEIRAEDDKPPLPDGKGEIILDPTWLQYAQMKEGMGMEQGGGFGDDQEGGEGGEDDFESQLNQFEKDDEDDDNEDQDKDKDQDKEKKEDTEKSFRMVVTL